MRKSAKLATFAMWASMVSACGLATDDKSDDRPANEGEVTQKEVTSCTSALTGGTYAATSCFNSGSPALLSIKDEKCDSHSVYVLYQINGGKQIRLENSAGCGHTAYVTLGSGSFTIDYKDCVDIQFQGDVCSRPIQDFN